MKVRYLIFIMFAVLLFALSNVAGASADELLLTPPTDCQKYKPLTAVSTTVYVVESKNTYMACKVGIEIEQINAAYLFINQNYPFNSKFDPKNLSKGILIDKEYIIDGYIVFNMKDYKGVVENSYPNKVVIGIEKTDGTIVFSNTVLLLIAKGDMTCEAEIIGDRITYKITEGFLPIDPATISLKANGIDIPYYFNEYNDTVTALLAPTEDGTTTLNIEFKVKDLRGQGVVLNDIVELESVMETAQQEFTRVHLAKYIYDISDYELIDKVYSFTDLDYIPYETRLIASTLKEHDLMTEYKVGNSYEFRPNQRVTQQMFADIINKFTGRELYKPENPSSYINVNDAIKELLKTLEQ